MTGSGDPRNEAPLSTRSGIAESRQRLLREISGSPDVTFIRAGGNIGDDLIHAGTRRLLEAVFYDEVKLRKRRKEEPKGPSGVRRLLPGALHKESSVPRHREAGIGGLGGVRGHTALVTGGGAWCRPFHGTWPVVLPLIEKRFERVIVLPSSVDTSVEEVREALARTKALVFARERESYRQLRELCRAEIAHDCAFYFDFTPYRRRGEGRLMAYRTDAESSAGGRVPPDNNDISRSCDSLDQWLWTIARHEVVETDRAHVMIAAAMLGKKVRYRPSSYHKVPEIAAFALEGYPVERILEENESARTSGAY